MTLLTRGDRVVESAADKLQGLANTFATQGRWKARVAEEVADDATFVRRLKPSLMKARWRGEAPTDQPPGSGAVAPSGPQLGPRPEEAGPGAGRTRSSSSAPRSSSASPSRSSSTGGAMPTPEAEPVTAAVTPEAPEDGSLGSAVKGITEHASALARLEVELAQFEIKKSISALGLGAGLAAAALLVALYAVGFLFATIAAGLATFLAVWLSLLIVTIFLLLVVGILLFLAKRSFKRGGTPVPKQAIAEAKQTTEVLKS